MPPQCHLADALAHSVNIPERALRASITLVRDDLRTVRFASRCPPGRLGRGARRPAVTAARRFAHTLVPIGLAYAFAHYFTLVLFEGQLLLSTMSDPFGLGWDLFGTADRPIDFSLIAGGSAWVWWVQLTAIIAGHVTGVVLAHDRALADFEGPGAVRSQYAMLVLMVFLTGLGLAILST